MTQPVPDQPRWERELRAAAVSKDQSISPFMTAPFVNALQAAVGSEFPLELRARLRIARERVDQQFGGDRRYDELRARIAASYVLWRIDDDRQLTDMDFEAIGGLKSAPSIERRTFRQGLAQQRYQAVIGGEDYGLMRLQKSNVTAGAQHVTRVGWCDALIALLYSIIEKSTITEYWDPTVNQFAPRTPVEDVTTTEQDDDGGSVESQVAGDMGDAPSDQATSAPGSTAPCVDEATRHEEEEGPTGAKDLAAPEMTIQREPAPGPGSGKTVRRGHDSRRWRPAAIAIAAFVILVTVVGSGLLTLSGRSSLPSDDGSPTGESAAQSGAATSVSTTGWGPERTTVPALSRNTVVTLNSMTDNPVAGDERNFLQVRPLDADNESYSDQTVVRPGVTYVGSVYFNNDAAPDPTKSVALGVRLRIQMAALISGSGAVQAILSADNSSPREVWDVDSLILTDPSLQAAPRFIAGSATIHSNGPVDGATLDDAVFGNEGALLGCDALDGRLSSEPRCSGYVTFRFIVDQANFDFSASAHIKGSGTSLASTVSGRPGDVVEVEVTYENTGTTRQNDVVMRVADLPTGLRFVSGSLKWANSASDGLPMTADDWITIHGFNLGNYDPGGKVYVRFDLLVEQALVASGSKFFAFDPFVTVETNNGDKTAKLTLIAIG